MITPYQLSAAVSGNRPVGWALTRSSPELEISGWSIGHSIANGSPPLRHLFKWSCCVARAQWRGDGSRPIRYTRRRSTASIMKDLFDEQSLDQRTQARRRDNVTGTGRKKLWGARKVYLCEFEGGTKSLFECAWNEKGEDQKQKVFIPKVLWNLVWVHKDYAKTVLARKF